MEPAEKERATPKAVEQERTVLTVQVLWGCQAYNATPEQAAKQVAVDLFEHLSRGGSVSVHLEKSDGSERMLEVTARSKWRATPLSPPDKSTEYVISRMGFQQARKCLPHLPARMQVDHPEILATRFCSAWRSGTCCVFFRRSYHSP
jgi:hypothetical protein